MKGLSLFANVGIAEIYSPLVGLEFVVANELLEKRADFYSEMHPSSQMICGDITDTQVFDRVLSASKNRGVDFILATPPCQGMSRAGMMCRDDERNNLIKYVVKMALALRPSAMLIENVPTALNTKISHEGKAITIRDFVVSALEPEGYFVKPVILDCADYGTPQHRERAFFLCSKEREWPLPPTQAQITLRDAISHLPSLESGESSEIAYHYAKEHNARHTLGMRHTPTGNSALFNEIHYPKKADGERIKAFPTSYKRMEWHKPAPTITMSNGYINSQNNVHPGGLKSDGTYSDARVLTLKEIFILSGLPDDWMPPKWASDTMIREVIGEGIPPKMIEALLREYINI